MNKNVNNKISILVVEDDKDLNDAYKSILSSDGYTVNTAFNGEEALEKLLSIDEPKLILLDLRMPILDGIGFLEKYDTAAHPSTAIIIFSNYEAQKEVDEAYELGAHRYILKARATPNELIRIVRDITTN